MNHCPASPPSSSPSPRDEATAIVRVMQVAFALFSDAANLSQEGKLNVLGVFDALQVASLPAVHPRAHLVVHLKGTSADVGKHSVTLRWINPHGSELWHSTGDLDVGHPPGGITEMDLPIIAQLDLPLDEPGPYTMSIQLDQRHVAQLTVHVRAAVPVAQKGVLLS